MAQIQETPLDERQWRSPVALNNLQYFGGLHSKTVHLYFMESDFFDRTSNNWALFMQHKGEPWLTDRDQFELRLRAMQGLEFMVAAEPERRPDGTDTGIYVFRKQQRRKRPGHDDDLTVLGTYYLIGENIYQAASLEDIIGNKIVMLPICLECVVLANPFAPACCYHLPVQILLYRVVPSYLHVWPWIYLLPAFNVSQANQCLRKCFPPLQPCRQPYWRVVLGH